MPHLRLGPLVCCTAVLLAAADSIVAEELRLTARQLLESATTQNLALSTTGASLQIERGVLYEDDGPAAGYCYGPNEERLSGQIAVRKELIIDRPNAAKAFLLVGPGGDLVARLNQKPLRLSAAGKAGQYWQQYEFDPAGLVAGKNEFVLSGSGPAGGKVWIARNEDFAAGSSQRTQHPDRSAKSSDGGQTWSDERLGTAGNLDGEYYVRVFLDQVRPQGSLTTGVLDAANLAGAPLAPAIKQIEPVHLAIQGSGNITLRFRSGTTFVPSPKTWTDWQPLAGREASVQRPAGRYFQVRIELAADDPLASPRLDELTITAAAETASSWHSRVKVVENHNPKIVRSAIPFEYEPLDHPRLLALRQQWKLDEVVADAKSELELIGQLAVWASQRWDKGHLAKQYPPWDAGEILKTADDGTPVGGFCQQYNVVFLQACESFGLCGRAVSIGPGDSGLAGGKIRGGHEVVEIWSNQFAKWIYVDGNAAWYFTDAASGVPLSLRELRDRQLDALVTTDPDSIKHVKLADSKYEWTGLKNWPPFLELRLIPRSNFLAQAAPLPLNQGMRGWFWTGHHVWSDDRAPASLLYGQRVSQTPNWDWTLNQAHIRLTATDKPDELHLELDTQTPGFETFLVKIDEQPSAPSNGTFNWKLHLGRNRLEAIPRNVAGREGVRSWIVLDVPGR